MTEDQIERKAERKMDVLDSHLLDGILSQEEYDQEVYLLEKWTNQQYRNMRFNHLFKVRGRGSNRQ